MYMWEYWLGVIVGLSIKVTSVSARTTFLVKHFLLLLSDTRQLASLLGVLSCTNFRKFCI